VTSVHSAAFTIWSTIVSGQGRQTMGWYHALAEEHGDKPRTVYHLCRKGDWDGNKSMYYPRTYDDDKFTRSMHEAPRIVEAMNCMYKDDGSEWICLQVDTMGLKVHGVEIEMVKSDLDPALQCPHIFGGLPREAVTKVYPVNRGTDGEFLSVVGLTDVSRCGTRVEL
jgi:uncharacterized protein (DUF952 family)